jgi:ABC-type sulfate transport system substrate-binding protein
MLAVAELGMGSVEIVTPSIEHPAEPPVAVVDAIVDCPRHEGASPRPT